MFRSRLRTWGRDLAQNLRLPTMSTIRPSTAPYAMVSDRMMHSVPALNRLDPQKGIPTLLDAYCFDLAWTKYMQWTLDKLNALTADSELQGLSVKSIALLTAREPSQAPIFNYASMAHNNHFFFEAIAPAPVVMPSVLTKELVTSFSSIETLQREFEQTAAAMFGPGFVWLVKAGAGSYRIMTTYLAGSPYPGAHWRAQNADMNTLGDAGTAQSYMSFKPRDASTSLPPGGIEVQPLLCLNTWEHVWLLNWGFQGKLEYAAAWWNLVDWDLVASRANLLAPGPNQFKGASTGFQKTAEDGTKE